MHLRVVYGKDGQYHVAMITTHDMSHEITATICFYSIIIGRLASPVPQPSA